MENGKGRILRKDDFNAQFLIHFPIFCIYKIETFWGVKVVCIPSINSIKMPQIHQPLLGNIARHQIL
jgi:hypothetical protein